MVDTDKTSCNCCGELITKGAHVCHHCGRNQKLLMRCLAPALQWFSLIVSAALLLLAWGQFNEARNQRQSANEALIRAKAAEERVTKVAKASLPVFKSLLTKTGGWGFSYSPREINNLTKPLKDALAESEDKDGLTP